MTRLLAIVTDAVEGRESVEALRGPRGGEEVEVRVVMPAVEESAFRHALGDVDGPVREAGERLEASLEELRRSGIPASGAVGDADPVLAAQDALREAPADEVVIIEREPDQARWFEEGLFERAREELVPPLRMVLVSAAGDGPPRVVDVERSGAGTEERPGAESEVFRDDENLPSITRGDLGGMISGIVGTIAAIVLAAAGPGPETTAGAAAILIAIGVSLLNMAHVVGLVLLESVNERGGPARFLRTTSLYGTPLAVLVNLILLLAG